MAATSGGFELGLTIEELSPGVIGKKLGQDLYNSNGNVLLRQGVEIRPNYYAHFEKNGYKSIYVLSSQEATVDSPLPMISGQLLASGPRRLREIFRVLKYEDRKRVVQAKEELISLATGILENLDSARQTQPLLLDLKRQEDYLYQHSINVAAYSALLGRRLGYEEPKLLSLTIAALVHDFGMEFIDDAILNKTTRLDEKELATVREHTVKGFKHLFNCGFLDPLCSLASVQHHENFDGSGYPKQISGGEIHEFSRIIYLTDFFDAWTSDRPHRRLHTVTEATEFIKRHVGTLFDPKMGMLLVELFD